MWSLLTVQLLNGLVLGMIYALAAAGLTLIFGMLDIPNFAHGAFYALGAYLAYTVAEKSGSFALAFVLAPIAVGVLGLAVDTFFLRRLARAGHVYQILFTLGAVLVIQETIVLLWGADSLSVDVPSYFAGGVEVGLVLFPYYRLFLVAVGALTIAAVWLALERTRYGAIIRAGIEDPDMVSCLGIDVARLFMVVFGLGVALAGLAGALIVPVRGGQPAMGTQLTGLSFVVVVIGGMGSFAGAVAGGLLVGVTQALMTVFYPAASQVGVFAAMAAVLLVRPQGLFGIR